MTASANRAIGKSNRFQRRLSSQEGREMASRVNREGVLGGAGGKILRAEPGVERWFCGRLEVKFLRPTRRFGLGLRIRREVDGHVLVLPGVEQAGGQVVVGG